jgi:glycosyltransferase involved in cell wall biosynthesis
MDGVPWGGSEELWAAMAEEALARDVGVEAFLLRWPSVPPRVARLQAQGLRIVYRERGLPDLRVRARAKLAGSSAYLASQLRSSKADLLCVSQGSTYDLLSPENGDTYRLLQTASIPYALICHHNLDAPIPEGQRPLAKALFGRAALVVFIAHRHRELTERQLAACLPNAIVLQNPVNLKSFDRVDWPSAGIARLACVGRLETMSKGHDALLEALSSPVLQGRDWVLSMYGDGPDGAYLRDLATRYGLIDKVRFVGHVNDIPRIWAENELAVLCSRTEGTSLSLVEALICGRPAVVTEVGDSARWVQEGETGFVAEGPTAASVRRALDRAWLARPQWREMGERAHRNVVAMIDRRPGATLLDALLKSVPRS